MEQWLLNLNFQRLEFVMNSYITMIKELYFSILLTGTPASFLYNPLFICSLHSSLNLINCIFFINCVVSTKVVHRKCTKICEDNEHDNAGDNDWYADKNMHC